MRRTGSLGVLEHFSFSVNFSTRSGRSCYASLSVPSRCLHFYYGFVYLYSHFLVDAGCCVGFTVSSDENVGDVGEDEFEELVDRPGTTNGT